MTELHAHFSERLRAEDGQLQGAGLPGSRTNDPFSDDQSGCGIRVVNHPVKQLNITERKQTALMRLDPFRELDSVAQLLGRQSGNRQMGMPMDAYRQGDQFIGLTVRAGESGRWDRSGILTCAPTWPARCDSRPFRLTGNNW